MPGDGFVVIRLFAYRYQAELVKGLLDGEGIASVIIADDCGGYYPNLTAVSSGIKLLVNKIDANKAEETIKGLALT